MTDWLRCFSALFVLVAGGVVRTQAKTVDVQAAECAAQSWLAANPKPLQMDMGHHIDAIDMSCCTDGTALYYIVYLDPHGFVIVSAEEDMEPIIGFGQTGGTALAPGGVLARLISEDLHGRLRNRTRAHVSAPQAGAAHSKRKRKWRRLVDQNAGLQAIAPQVGARLQGPVSLKTKSIDDIRVSPLTRSKWGQQSVCGRRTYNYYTPQSLPAGCVATAMAQLMLYHQHPLMGIGVHDFAIWINEEDDSARTRGGDGQGGPYVWSDMVLAPDCSLTDTQRQAMGALCHDAGLAVYTSYEQSGSGAYGSDIAQAFTGTFLFRNAITGYNNENNLAHTSDLAHMINPNLDANYPVILGIFGESGHALVVDGYGYNEDTLYHHLNLGFEGAYDVWYNLPNILDYNAISHCIYNCFPDQEGQIISGRVTDAYGQPVSPATVTAVSTLGSFSTTTDKRGIYALSGIPAPSRYRITVSESRLDFRSRMTKLNVSEDLTLLTGNRWQIDFRAFAAGDYNGDSHVDLLDFAVFAQHWRSSGSDILSRPELHAIGDQNADIVDVFDLKLFLLDWLVETDQEVPPGSR